MIVLHQMVPLKNVIRIQYSKNHSKINVIGKFLQLFGLAN